MGYGFNYLGKKSMSLYFMLYFKTFYKNITLYSYKDKYLSLSKLLMEYTIDKIHDFSEISRYNTFLSNKIKNYSSFINK
jgi:ABC-type polysaccharide/polyol phosphate transport system ATPase subunit